MTETKMRTLPADVYDTLELAAEAFGGVGKGQLYTCNMFMPKEERQPCCAHGLADFADPHHGPFSGGMRAAIFGAGIDGGVNDRAFAPDETRIPFATWCARLGVERGSDV